MHRIYCRKGHIAGDIIKITDKNDTHHLRDVLRLKPQDKVVVFDEEGNEYTCLIKNISKELSLGICARRQAKDKAPHSSISIACALPKKCRMDDIVDKLTQLGVERIIPLRSERVVIRLDKNKELLRLKRWEKIALSAAQQSQRNSLPAIDRVREIKEFLSSENKKFDLKIIPTLDAAAVRPLADLCKNVAPGNILALIGPEGDFTPAEVALAESVGFIPVTLGRQVLRVDTAAITVAGFLRLYYE